MENQVHNLFFTRYYVAENHHLLARTKQKMMKKYLIPMALCLITRAHYAQINSPPLDETRETTVVGWEIGFNRFTLMDFYDYKLKHRKNLRVGMFLEPTVKDNWNLLFDIVYERKGTYNSGIDVNYKLTYLYVSASPKFQFYNFYAYSGFYYGYLINATDDIPKNFIIPGAYTSDKFKKNDFGWKMCLGIQFYKKISLELGFDSGIASVYDKPYYGASGHVGGYVWVRGKSLHLTVKVDFKEVRLKK